MDTRQQISIASVDFRTVIASSVDGFTLVDASNGDILDVNDSYCRMVGYTCDELLKMHMSDIDAIDTPMDVAERSQEIIRNGSLRFETKHLHKTGFEIDVEVTANYSPLDGGTVFSFVRDITQKNLIEKAHRLSEERYKNIVENQTEFVERFLPGGIMTYVNDSLAKFAGVPAEELLGKSFYPFIHKADRDETIRRIEFISFDNPTVETENRVVLPDGSIRWNCWTQTGFFDENGAIVEYQSVGRDITERKAVEGALRTSESRYRLLVETASEGILVSQEATLKFVNPMIPELTGYTEEELLSIPFLEFIHPDYRELMKNNYVKRINGEPVDQRYEIQIAKKDGSFKWVEISGAKINWEDQPATLNFVTDVTDRKRSEESLRESEERYRLLSETMLQGVVYQDANGTVISMNPAAERILGKNRAEFLGSSSVKVEHQTKRENGEPFPGIEHPTMVALQTGQPVGNVVMGVFNPKLDEYRWISIGAVPIFRPDETSPYGAFAVFEDITGRKLIEEKVRKSEHQFRSLFDEMTEGAVLHSVIRNDSGAIVNYRIEMANPAYSDILGLSPEEVTGKLATEAYGTDTPPYLKEFAEVTESRRSIRFSTYFPSLDKHFDISAIPWESNGFATIFLDITSRIKAEESQRQQTEQLQQSQRLESLGVLAGGIAHDFNNILAIIMGYSSLIKMDYETAKENIPQIEKAAERAAALCRQMLAYAGKATLTQTQVNIWMLVDEMVNMLKATIPQNVVIKPELSIDIPFINGDASQIRQIAMNLIINASEAIGEAQGEVRVSLSKRVIITGQSEKDYLGKIIPPGWYACLEVADNGCGMSDETYNRIFEPFYTTKFTGRGLGMSAVLGIIKAHNGSLWLFSEQGKGTTFKVYLPAQISAATVEESLQQITSTPWQASGTILLVEDEAPIRLISKTLLQKFGFTVLEAVNGKEALELYQRNASDIALVITDMGMPVMDGYELIRELKKLNPELPIIISSGFGEGDVTSRISREDFAGLISKPYNPSQLREVLKSIVEGAQKPT